MERVVLEECGTGKRGRGTNADTAMLWVVVDNRAGRVVSFGHGEYQLENRSA